MGTMELSRKVSELRELRRMAEELAAEIEGIQDATKTRLRQSGQSAILLCLLRPCSCSGGIVHGRQQNGCDWGNTTRTGAFSSPRTMGTPCTRTA